LRSCTGLGHSGVQVGLHMPWQVCPSRQWSLPALFWLTIRLVSRLAYGLLSLYRIANDRASQWCQPLNIFRCPVVLHTWYIQYLVHTIESGVVLLNVPLSLPQGVRPHALHQMPGLWTHQDRVADEGNRYIQSGSGWAGLSGFPLLYFPGQHRCIVYTALYYDDRMVSR
jgi:hypothetical protein